jgi:hypothetical protein
VYAVGERSEVGDIICWESKPTLNDIGSWVEWMARRPKVAKKDGALRFGILGAAAIASV